MFRRSREGIWNVGESRPSVTQTLVQRKKRDGVDAETEALSLHLEIEWRAHSTEKKREGQGEDS